MLCYAYVASWLHRQVAIADDHNVYQKILDEVRASIPQENLKRQEEALERVKKLALSLKKLAENRVTNH